MARQEPLPKLPSRYRLWPDSDNALLGTGGASAVWRVKDEALGSEVALKVLKSEGHRFHARLEREAVLSSRIVHPNVIALHDVGRTPDGKSYLAFALASDGSMLDLAPAPPPWPELKQLTIELLRALGAMHARGILHLDVKLSNLLLHRPDKRHRQLWLADLGVARALWGEDDDDKTVVGTVSYMAPERLTGQHHLWCPSTDLFAVGAVLYRLLTGRLPYPARDPAEGMTQRMSPPRRLIARPSLDIPVGLDDIVLPMLQPDHRGRYDLAGDVIRALEALPAVGERPGATDVKPLPGDVSELSSANPAGQPASDPAPGVPTWFRPPPRLPPEHLERARATHEVPQAPALLKHREIELVGRETEFDLLWRAARTAMRTRRPVLVEVTGPRGVGRTRLVDEFLRAVEEQGLGEGASMEYAVASGPALGLHGAWRRVMPPGSSQKHFVQEIATSLARDRGAAVADALPDAQVLARWLDPEPGDAPQYNRSALRGMLVEHLERRSWRGLSWLRVEDAHLADGNDDCWPIIDRLMSRSAPMLVVVCTRSGEISPSLLELRALHHQAVRTVELEPLSPPVSEELLDAFLPLEPSLRSRVAAHGRGIPRAMHELLSWWISSARLIEQAVAGRGRTWTLDSSAAVLPPDQRAFALARLRDVQDDRAVLRALQALAVSGPGTPEVVLSRVAGDAVDRLVLDRLVDLEGGLPAFNPPEIGDVILERLDRSDRSWQRLHADLAQAWAQEGDAPAVLARVGAHLQEAGDDARALQPLDRALRGLHQTLSVARACDLAGRVIGAAEATGQRGTRAWLHAALVLADARWRKGDADGASEVDAAIAAVELPPPATLQAACARVRRVGPTRTEALSDLARLKPLLTHVESHHRAELHTTLALAHAWRLDVESAIAELHRALASQPRPETACRARLLRARLLKVIDPVVGWHEALRTIEVARDHGLLRYEVLAWGLAAPDMVALGKGDEAIERLQSGVDRLVHHGEELAAREARLHLGAALRAAGRTTEAQRTFRAALDGGHPAFGTHPTDARAALGVLLVLEQRADEVLELMSRSPGWVGPAAAWALLQSLALLLKGEVSEPRREAVDRALALGDDGLFIVRAIADLLVLKDETERADAIEARLAAVCQRFGVDGAQGEALLQRFHRARR